MKIETTSAVLKNLVQAAYKAVEAKPMSAWMGGILLKAGNGKLAVTATNGQFTISREAETGVQGDAEMLVDGKTLASIVAKLPNGGCTLSVGSDGKKVSLHAGTSKTNLTLLNADEFAQNGTISPTVTARVGAGELKRIVAGILYAVAQADSRIQMTGILLQIRPSRIFAVGLDGFRLGVCRADCEGSSDVDLIVPAKAMVRALSAIGDNDAMLTLASDGKALTMDGDGVSFRTVLIGGTYIDYQKIIPKDTATAVKIDVAMMRDAVERALVVSNRNQTVKIAVSDNTVTIQSNGEAAETQETMELPVQGDPLEIAFNGRYLMDMLTSIGGESAVMKMTTPTAPVLVSPEDGNGGLHIVLPVRIM